MVSQLNDPDGDALWNAVTWYAFIDGLLARTEGSEHVKGAYTILSAPGFSDHSLAFSPDPDPAPEDPFEGPDQGKG